MSALVAAFYRMRTASGLSTLAVATMIAIVSCGPTLSNSQRFTVTVTLSATNVSLSELKISMEYTQGELCGTAATAQCSAAIGLDSGVFDDQEDADNNGTFILDATLQQAAAGMQANDAIFHCTFSSLVTPSSSNFVFTVNSARDVNDNPVASGDLAAIALTVQSSAGEAGACQASSTTTMMATTTTTSSTTTTAVPTTSTTTSTSTTTTSSTTTSTVSTSTTTVTNAPTTTTMPSAGSSTFDVTFEFTFPMTAVRTLQFDSDYSAAGGDFDGTGAGVACTKAAGLSALGGFSDDDAGKVLLQGFTDNSGFAAPRILSTCRFVDADGVAPKASDFANSTTDCSDLNSMPMSCFTGVKSVTACSCGDGTVNCVSETCDSGSASTTQICGDGIVNCSGCTSEQCDDGNTVDDGNGCTGDCQDGHVCGNNLVESLFEQCDDGGTCQTGSNPGTPCSLPAGTECMGGFCQTQSGDGCDSNCLLEP